MPPAKESVRLHAFCFVCPAATADLRAQEGAGWMDSFAFADCLDVSKGVPRMSFGCLWLAVQKKVKMLDSQASRLLEGTFC